NSVFALFRLRHACDCAVCRADVLVPDRFLCWFFFTNPSATDVRTLSLHDALPILLGALAARGEGAGRPDAPAVRCGEPGPPAARSEEHTSELQSRFDLVCRLLLEKKKSLQRKASQVCARRLRS